MKINNEKEIESTVNLKKMENHCYAMTMDN